MEHGPQEILYHNGKIDLSAITAAALELVGHRA
jgi:hypothetical protein